MSSDQVPLPSIPSAMLCPMAEKPSPLPSTDPARVLCEHFAKLLVSIQSPDLLAAFLYVKNLISHETRGKVTSSSGSFVGKSNILLSAMEETLLASRDQKSMMLNLCAVLEESDEPSLRKIAADMRTCITG